MRQLKISKSITQRESASLSKYLQEVAQEELITSLEEVELAQRIRAGDQQALEKLVKANLRFVVSVAKQYQNQWLMLPDLINEGNLGLVKAAQRFDESRGFKFISYAVWWIRQSILQALAEQARMVRLPLNKVGQLNKVMKITSVLEQQLERAPTVEEIAEVLEMKTIDVADALKSWSRHVSLDAQVTEHDDNDMTNMDNIPNHEKPTDYTMAFSQSLQHEIERSLATLTTREQQIIVFYFGLQGNTPLSLEEIWEKLDITRERVRQIKEKAIRKLKHTSRSKHLKQFLS